MSSPDSSFFVSSGTLRPDAASYLERPADVDLFEGLIYGSSAKRMTEEETKCAR